MTLSCLSLASLSLSVSFAQTKWFKYEGNPVLDTGPPGAWDGRWAGVGRVIIDSSYRMWYTGSNGMSKQIGLAVSSDGIHWKKHPSNPVLPVDSSGWDSVEASFAYVSHVGPTYHMWYSGGDSRTYGRIGYAHSADGVTWKRLPSPVLGGGSSPMESVPLGGPSVVGPDSVNR
ncbi:MAG: hypothetical protein A2X67_01940 [Ignavibacteria bacterium GWA2_55_11]|nr:MAG: hypothetical protein A2X67_01940 [Ignavibacteria bacterium GWA2_55_11]OGU46611.1 MAG: hypothetical protein A2X68_09460 [Ignavibacteria bacterium GWC2_56_12]OGU71139.1 MAG: hypothetical protein A3H45_12850 [Ignavibacteria bacterium RIFCSPLOWO2_02_FULL_55_14]